LDIYIVLISIFYYLFKVVFALIYLLLAIFTL